MLPETAVSDLPATPPLGAAVLPVPFEPPTLDALSRENPARWMYERLKQYVKDFESHLDDEHEIAARLVSFGQTLTFHIEDMGYFGPDIVTFFGKNEVGEPVQLVQHVSQLSVLLVALRKQEERPRRIGFVLDRKDGRGAPPGASPGR